MPVTAVDDFEDGDINIETTGFTGWSGDTANFSADSTTVISGTYSGKLNTDSGFPEVYFTASSGQTAQFRTSVRIGKVLSSSKDKVRLRWSSGGTTIARVIFRDDGNIGTGGAENHATWSADTNYDIRVVFDWSNDTFDVYLDGTLIANDEAMDNSSNNDWTSYDEFYLFNQANNSGAIRNVWIDSIKIGKLEAPSGLSATVSNQDDIDLAWTNNDTYDNIEVYRALSTGSTVGDYTLIATISGSSTSYSDTGLDDGEKYFYRVRGTTSDGETSDLSNEDSAITVLPAPSGLATSNITPTSFDLSWTVNADNGTQRVEFKRSSDTTWSTDASDLALTTTTETVGGLLNGEQYDVRVVAVTNHTETASPSLAETTTLPAAVEPTLGNGVEDEVSVGFNYDINYGSWRVQIEETGTGGDWVSTDPGWAEATPTNTATSHTFIGREDGEEYRVRMRAETEHVTGAWTTPVSIVTKFPGATGLTLTVQGSTQIDLDWTDNSDNEDGFEVWRAGEKDPKRDTGFTAFAKVDTVGANTISYSDTTVEQNHDYKYFVRAFTEHTSADSSTKQATTEIDVGPGWSIQLEQSGDTVAVRHENITSVSRLQPEKSGTGRWELEVPDSPYASNWLHAEAYIRYDGQLVMRGEFLETRSRESAGTMRLVGKDVANKLTRGGADVPYQNIEGWKAFDDYVTNHVDGWTVTVTEPTPKTLEDDKVVQDASTTTELSSIFSPAADEPFAVQNGNLELLQTCFTVEGEDANTTSGTSVFGADRFSGNSPTSGQGEALEFTGSGLSATWDFTPAYDIPASAVGIHLRIEANNAPQLEATLNGATWTILEDGGGVSLQWQDVANDPFDGTPTTYTEAGGTKLSAGTTYTLQIDSTTSGGTGASALVDVVAPADNRFSYTFDTTLTDGSDGGTYFDGPELYPQAATLQGAVHDDVNNVTEITLATTFDDTSGSQKLQVSNDGGTNWLPNDGTEANTTSVSVSSFPQVGTTAEGRATLSRYGSRSNATPLTGFNGQVLQSWTLDIDTNALAVIDDREYVGSHFRNIDTIAADAELAWVPTYQETGLHIEAFAEGDVVKAAPWSDHEVLDVEEVDSMEGYANVQTVYGAVVNGKRLVATAKSQDEITAKGGEIHGTPVRDESLETQGDVDSKARTLLANRLAKDRVTGTLEVVPMWVQPGYAYTVPELGNRDLTLERAEFSQGSAGMRLDFEGQFDVAAALRSIQTEVERVKDAV